MQLDKRRNFTGHQRVQLYIQANGKCRECGNELQESWHAHHVTPWIKGGQTTIDNGQALCPPCNQAKGSKMSKSLDLGRWPESEKLRDWQQLAFADYVKKSQKHYLVFAWFGGGKTLLGLRIAHHLMQMGEIDRIVVVVHTSGLKTQWADTASRVGLDLDPTFSNKQVVEAADMHGVILSYQQVGREPLIHKRHCEESHTLVIFDEPHHMAEENNWGVAALVAFENAERILLGTGTPYRSKKSECMPFVKTEIVPDFSGDKIVLPDYVYTYSEALDDNVCRRVEFNMFDGVQRWRNDGELREATFDDTVPRKEQMHRLRAALVSDGSYMEAVINAAWVKIKELRGIGDKTDHADAAVLVITGGIEEAKDVGKLITRLTETKEKPIVITSDDEKATKKIDDFRDGKMDGNGIFLVAVNMVSEGIDIPRLRVCVYVTPTRARLFFYQAVGRVVRRIEEDIPDGRNGVQFDNEYSYIYLPSDPVLGELAKEIIEDRELRIKPPPPTGPGPNGNPSTFVPVSSEGELVGHIVNGVQFSREQIERTEMVRSVMGVSYSTEEILNIVKVFNDGVTIVRPQMEQKGQREKRKYIRKAEKRSIVNKLVGKMAYQSGGAIPNWLETGRPNGTISRILNKYDNKNIGNRTEAELEMCIDVLERGIMNGAFGDYSWVTQPQAS